jgi:hypothetical protein
MKSRIAVLLEIAWEKQATEEWLLGPLRMLLAAAFADDRLVENMVEMWPGVRVMRFTGWSYHCDGSKNRAISLLNAYLKLLRLKAKIVISDVGFSHDRTHRKVV